MSSQPRLSAEYLASVCLFFISAVGLLALVLFIPDIALAQEPASADPGPSRAPGIVVSPAAPLPDSSHASRKTPDMRDWLVEEDASAALEHLRVALTQVEDGSTYVWHRSHGRLSGTVKITSSFVASSGRLCRHMVATMTAGGYSKQTEGVACRLENGRWQLEG